MTSHCGTDGHVKYFGTRSLRQCYDCLMISINQLSKWNHHATILSMRKSLCKAFWFVVCLTTLMSLALGQTGKPNAPRVFAISSPAPSGTNASRMLVSVSPDGIKKIAELSRAVLYGMDDETVAILQMSSNASRNPNRLLVVNRKTSAIIADRNLNNFQNGFHPVVMKLLDADCLAVRSEVSTVYIQLFNGRSFAVAEVNWKTGEIRPLSVPTAKGAERWEITALYSLPPGIAVERGPYFTIFDPANGATVLALNNAGSNLRPTGNYYAFPGFGLVQSIRAEDMLYHITQKDFSTMIPSPVGVSYPDSIKNLIKFSRPIPRTIGGKPCLIWGETQAGAPYFSISQIVVFDLEAKRELLRKSLGAGFSSGFLTDSTGQNIYFINSQAREIFRLNLASQKLNSFTDLGTNHFECWVAAN